MRTADVLTSAKKGLEPFSLSAALLNLWSRRGDCICYIWSLVCPCHFVIGQQSVYGLSLFLAVFRGPAVLSPARMDSSSTATTASPVTVSVLPVPVPSPTSPLIFLLVALVFFDPSHLSCNTQYVPSKRRRPHVP